MAWFTHISGHPSAAGRAQDRESSPVRDRRSTTVPRHTDVNMRKVTTFEIQHTVEHACVAWGHDDWAMAVLD